MIVEAHVVRFDSISLDGGATLAPVEVAYETYGALNAQKSNAILILHAFSGDAHAAGVSPATLKRGWWDNMIGPGKAFDTNKYFVICSNVLGGCRGTTGPASINPATGCPYAMSFPVITIRDMVRLQKMLIDHLGIPRLLSLSGGSMGGMAALEWAVSYPDAVVSTIPIAATARHSAQQIAFNEVGRQAIIADPDWSDGNYYGGKPPARGLAVPPHLCMSASPYLSQLQANFRSPASVSAKHICERSASAPRYSPFIKRATRPPCTPTKSQNPTRWPYYSLR